MIVVITHDITITVMNVIQISIDIKMEIYVNVIEVIMMMDLMNYAKNVHINGKL